MARKYFSNTAVATTLSANISNSDSSLTVASSTGYPAVPFTLAINAGTSSEEIIKVGAKSGTTFSTLTRGYNGTTARAHTSGASVKHVAVAEDFDNLYTHTHTSGDGYTNVPFSNVTGTIPLNQGGTGLTSTGSAGQVLKINSAGNALEYGNVEAVFNIDGMTDGSSATIADSDKFAISDGGTEKYVNASQIKTYVGPLTQEQVEDFVGAMFSSNTETRVSATYDDTNGKINIVVDDMTANTQLSTEEVQDIVGAMFSSNTETRVSATYQDADGTIDLVVDDMTADNNTQLTEEQVQDFVGNMLTSNTETRIAVTYDDTNNKINFVVDDMTANDNTQLSAEQVQDIVGAMFSSNTETNITATYQDADGTIDLEATGNTTEQIQDIVGAMFSSNTETNITATYQDDDGTIDLVVSASDSTGIVDADSDTKIQAEESSDEDKLRFDTAGTERAIMDNAGLGLTTSGGIFRHHQTQAGTYTVAANEGAVMAGPITVTGTLTTQGTLVVL